VSGDGQTRKWRAWLGLGKPDRQALAPNLNNFEKNSFLNLIQTKTNLSELKKIGIKYSFEGFDERNNFFHRHFFRFEVNFELKNREALGFEFEENLVEFLLGTSKLDGT
jgi:hypothetical protein